MSLSAIGPMNLLVQMIGPMNLLVQMNPLSPIVHSSISWTKVGKPLNRGFNISDSYKLTVRPLEAHQKPH